MVNTKKAKILLTNMKLAMKSEISSLNSLPIGKYVALENKNNVLNIRTISGYNYTIDNLSSTEFNTCVLFDDFSKIIAKIKKDFFLEIAIRDNVETLLITSGNLSFNLEIKDYELFSVNKELQIIKNETPVRAIEFKFDDLIKELKFIFIACDNKPVENFINYTNGILFDFNKSGLNIVGTDGRRLHKVECIQDARFDQEIDFLIPVNQIDILLKLKAKDNPNVNFMFFDVDNEKYLILEVENYYTGIMELMNTPYPDYKRVIPNEFGYINEISANRVLDILNPLAIISSKEGAGNMLQIKTNSENHNLEFITSDFNSNRASAIIESKEIYSSNQYRSNMDNQDTAHFHYAININYFKQIIDIYKGEKITVSGAGSLQPLKYTCDKFPNRLSILMPVRCPEIE